MAKPTPYKISIKAPGEKTLHRAFRTEAGARKAIHTRFGRDYCVIDGEGRREGDGAVLKVKGFELGTVQQVVTQAPISMEEAGLRPAILSELDARADRLGVPAEQRARAVMPADVDDDFNPVAEPAAAPEAAPEEPAGPSKRESRNARCRALADDKGNWKKEYRPLFKGLNLRTNAGLEEAERRVAAFHAETAAA